MNNINNEISNGVHAITGKLASGMRRDESVVRRVLQEAVVISDNESLISMAEMRAFVRGR